MPCRDPVLTLDQIYFGYTPRRWEIEDCSFALEPGTHTTIIGPNGSGKSTLFKLLIRLLRPKCGVMTLAGRDIRAYAQRELARQIAFVPQDSDILFPLSGWDMVMMGRFPYLKRFAAESSADKASVEAAMRFTDTLNFAGRPVTELSGGERQRLLFARALAQDTSLFLLDEPYTHLDLQYQWKMRDWIAELVRDRHKTVLSVLHHLDHALCADTVMLWARGKPLQQGPAAEMLDKTRLVDLFEIR